MKISRNQDNLLSKWYKEPTKDQNYVFQDFETLIFIKNILTKIMSNHNESKSFQGYYGEYSYFDGAESDLFFITDNTGASENRKLNSNVATGKPKIKKPVPKSQKDKCDTQDEHSLLSQPDTTTDSSQQAL